MLLFYYIFFRSIIFAFTARIYFWPSPEYYAIHSLGEEYPKFNIQHAKHEAAYLGEESLLSHVCKQTDNKFEVQNEI